jgi:hypothetical protein
MRDRRWDFLYEREKQPVKSYVLERFAEELAGELRAWPPPDVEWTSEELRTKWAEGLVERPREQVFRFALRIARLEMRREIEIIDSLLRNEADLHWQNARERAAGQLLVVWVTEQMLSLKEYAAGAKITREDLAGLVDLLEKKLFPGLILLPQ